MIRRRGGDGRAPYAVPRYRARSEPAFYHVLHGAVPGHQMDFIYRPAVPQGALTQTHLAHAARLVKYIEPRERAPFAFAIGNLSRDDVHHEPGHGGLAIIVCLRVEGVLDHANRANPPFAHGLLAVDRALSGAGLTDVALRFSERLLGEGSRGSAASFYREYVRRMREEPLSVERLLREHVAAFDALPQPERGDLGVGFVAPEGESPPERVTIVHADSAPFEDVVSAAASLAAALYRSNVKWTALSSGREIDIPGGTTVRFVPESEAPRSPQGLVLRLDELPAGAAEIAAALFSAAPASRPAGVAVPGGWRARLAKKTERGAASGQTPREGEASGSVLTGEGAPVSGGESGSASAGESGSASQRAGQAGGESEQALSGGSRSRKAPWIAGGVAALAIAIALWRMPWSPADGGRGAEPSLPATSATAAASESPGQAKVATRDSAAPPLDSPVSPRGLSGDSGVSTADSWPSAGPAAGAGPAASAPMVPVVRSGKAGHRAESKKRPGALERGAGPAPLLPAPGASPAHAATTDSSPSSLLDDPHYKGGR